MDLFLKLKILPHQSISQLVDDMIGLDQLELDEKENIELVNRLVPYLSKESRGSILIDATINGIDSLVKLCLYDQKGKLTISAKEMAQMFGIFLSEKQLELMIKHFKVEDQKELLELAKKEKNDSLVKFLQSNKGIK